AQNMKLSDLLFANGGFDDPDWRRATYLERGDLIRTMPQDLSTTIVAFSLRRILEGDHKADIALQSMDRVRIYSFDEIERKDKYVQLEGHVKQPGKYLLSRNMRLSDLLFAYGGFEDEDWKKATYMERADIFRTNPEDLSVKQIEVNLRKVLERDPQADPLLQSLDLIMVFAYKAFHPDPSYTILGAVHVPGVYLLGQNTTLADSIVTAHGLLDEAYKYEAEVIRTRPTQAKLQQPAEKISVRIPENYASAPRDEGFRLMKDDVVFIRKVPGWERPRFVWALGEFEFPGQYILTKADERLSDLVARAGGLKKTAYAPGAVFARVTPYTLSRTDQTAASSVVLADFGGVAVFGKVPPDSASVSDRITSPSVLVANFSGAYDQPTTRTRTAIDLERALSKPGSANDVILCGGDLLRVPIDPMAVEVRGAIHVPARLQYQKGGTIKDYVRLCGGYSDDALRRDVLVIGPDGTTRRSGWRLFEPEVPSGSVIIVPPYEPGRGEDIIAMPLTATGTETTVPVALIQTPWPKLPILTPREIARREKRAVEPATRAAAAVTTPTALTQAFVIPPVGAIPPGWTMLPPSGGIAGRPTTA
ncbi:SLBB domain-containing protein, partial [Candidatus Sumerlaeota bacterium]|nr:SLBB domain-containing protein [Candidatus Sumerlaeota bacterium]